MRNANWHPTETELALFLANAGPDREEIASHLDACPRCAQTIVLSQQAKLQAELVPQESMPPALRASRMALMKKAIHEGLRPHSVPAMVSDKAPAKQPSPNPKPAGPPSNAQWGLLGGLSALGGWLVGESFGSPIPALGEKDSSAPHTDSLEGGDPREPGAREDSLHSAEDAAKTEPLPTDGGDHSEASDFEAFSVMEPDDVGSSSEDVPWRDSVDHDSADPYADHKLPGIDPPLSEFDGGALDPGEMDADDFEPDGLDLDELDPGESSENFDDQP